MRAKHLLFALFTLALGTTACENSFEEEVQPNEEPKTYALKFRRGGEADVTYEPLTRFTPDDRDLYGVQVWHKPATTGSYECYAYGLFDNVEDMELEVKENYKYRFEFKLIDDGKDKIFRDSVLVDNNYYLGYDEPFRGQNKYNGNNVSITKLTNEFSYAEDRYFTGNDYIKTPDGKTTFYPEDVDFYYAQINDYQPTENGAVLSVYFKRMVFGFKINIGDWFDNGKMTVELLDKEYTITPDNKEFEKTYAYHHPNSGNGHAVWYGYDEMSKAYNSTSLNFEWTKADETVVDWKNYSPVYYYRLKQTVFNLEYYGEDGVLGNHYFEAHYEDTPIEENYQSYDHGKDQNDYNW